MFIPKLSAGAANIGEQAPWPTLICVPVPHEQIFCNQPPPSITQENCKKALISKISGSSLELVVHKNSSSIVIRVLLTNFSSGNWRPIPPPPRCSVSFRVKIRNNILELFGLSLRFRGEMPSDICGKSALELKMPSNF